MRSALKLLEVAYFGLLSGGIFLECCWHSVHRRVLSIRIHSAGNDVFNISRFSSIYSWLNFNRIGHECLGHRTKSKAWVVCRNYTNFSQNNVKSYLSIGFVRDIKKDNISRAILSLCNFCWMFIEQATSLQVTNGFVLSVKLTQKGKRWLLLDKICFN